jgi:hypothetical protein
VIEVTERDSTTDAGRHLGLGPKCRRWGPSGFASGAEDSVLR